MLTIAVLVDFNPIWGQERLIKNPILCEYLYKKVKANLATIPPIEWATILIFPTKSYPNFLILLIISFDKFLPWISILLSVFF